MVETYVRANGDVVCTPRGDLDWRTSFAFRQVVDDALRPGESLLIDLSHVEFVDATGLSAIVGCYRQARTVHASIELCNESRRVRRRLELVMLPLKGSWLRNEPDAA